MPTTKPAFVAKDENIGGALLILEDYVSLFSRVAATGPTREIVQTRRTVQPTHDSQRLSRNRAARRAAVQGLNQDHISNVYHLNKRIEDMYTVTERRKNWQDPTVHPVLQSRPVRSARNISSLHQSVLEPWQQGYGYRTLAMSPRPGSAPAGWPSRRRRSADHYQGWSVTNSLRDTFPGDDFPISRYAKSPLSTLATDRAVYKAAIMAEVVSKRMYKRSHLRHLFDTYIKMAPLHDKEVVEAVVAELRDELCVD